MKVHMDRWRAITVHGSLFALLASELWASSAYAAPTPTPAGEVALDDVKAEVKNALSSVVSELRDLRTSLEKDSAKKDQKVKEAEKAREKAEDDAAAVRSGKLIQYGITAGIGPAVHIPLYRQSTVALGVMPYIMVHPAYWWNRPQQNRYCANIWSGKQSHDAASKAVDKEARERAERRAESLYAAIRVNPALELADLAPASPQNKIETRVHALLRDLRAVAGVPKDPEVMGGVHYLDRAKVRKARRDPKSATFASFSDCGGQPSDLRKSLCEQGEQASDINNKLALAVATHLVKELEDEVESTRRRRRMADDLEDGVDDLLAEALNLSELRLLLQEPPYVLYTTSGARRVDLSSITQADLDVAKVIVAARDTSKDTVDYQGKTYPIDTLEQALISELQVHAVLWMSDIPGKCNAHRFFGLWLGYPLKFRTTVPTRSGDDAIMRHRVTVTEIFAAGIGISPSAYISILAGISVGRVNIPPGDDDHERVLTVVLGLGGNLDILTLLRR